MTSIREEVVKYIEKKYKASPENLWRSYPDYAVFRHDDNRKWFAIIMDVDADKLGLPGNERIDIIGQGVQPVVQRADVHQPAQLAAVDCDVTFAWC